MAGELLDRRLSVAPMMDRTDRHERYLLRLISRRILLYTEMVTTAALVHGDRRELLRFHPLEAPVALQLGGCDPGDLAACARMGEDRGYEEVNLNLGCPSDRVQSGRFGAILMTEPDLVARCVDAMQNAVALPVTVKTRIGVDDQDSFEELAAFVGTVADAGCKTFIFHARKAWLKGLSPKENRKVPPLRYERVYRIKDLFPRLQVIINGGVTSMAAVLDHLRHVDGVMIGREAYANPYLLAEADAQVYGDSWDPPSRGEVLARYVEYARAELRSGVRINQLTRHLMGLFRGMPGARSWRRYLGDHGTRPGAGPEVLLEAFRFVSDGDSIAAGANT